MLIEEIIKQPEGKSLEFKENANPKAKILSTIIAFANTAGGRIIIGVHDKTHHIIGIDNPHTILESLASLIHDSIEPRIIHIKQSVAPIVRVSRVTASRVAGLMLGVKAFALRRAAPSKTLPPILAARVS